KAVWESNKTVICMNPGSPAPKPPNQRNRTATVRERSYRANILLVGGGGSVCLIARHRTSFNSSSSARSASEKSILFDAAAAGALAGFRSVSEIFGEMTV